MSWFTRMVARSKKNQAFTLIELGIVVVIVGVLAAVALGVYRGYTRKVGVYRGYTRKAMATEATAGLGTIRTALRAVYAQYEDYTKGGVIAAGVVGAQVPGIDAGDLQGTYFDHGNYSITTIDVTSFLLDCTGDASSGRGTSAGNSLGISMTLNQDGDDTYTAP